MSRRGDRLKILTWSAGGFLLLYKRLERGRFRLPNFEGQNEVELDATQLAMRSTGSHQAGLATASVDAAVSPKRDRP